MFAAELRSIAVGRQAVSELARLALRSVAENQLRSIPRDPHTCDRIGICLDFIAKFEVSVFGFLASKTQTPPVSGLFETFFGYPDISLQ